VDTGLPAPWCPKCDTWHGTDEDHWVYTEPAAGFGGQDITYETASIGADAYTSADPLMEEWHRKKEEFARNLFNYNVTIAARLAIGHGIDRPDVATWLRDLAYAIETQDVAEDMSPVDDINTLDHLIQ
jgi:hypothetical protein